MKWWISILCVLMAHLAYPQSKSGVYPGADEATPSRAQYFTWINNTNEGATAQQTLINLDFFKWLHDEYGMILDIYAFDAGAIDGKGFYGSIYSRRFKRQFPEGLDAIYQKARQMRTRLGVWGGPDGFGSTPEEEQARIDMMVTLCRDYDFMLFKFDRVSGPLRPEKQDAFIRMMKECRRYSPDLIVLNHRLNLGKARPYVTTSLWEGAETYIDVWMSNPVTGTHHRVGALSRGLPPGLIRMTEDHGVCLSSCLDYWEDDLILQAFNRCLILAPEIYGNPWLLRDDEFSRLARIYNLHRKYRELLVQGMVLPETTYGPHAVSRGNGSTRFITLRNLTWNPVHYTVKLDSEIGLFRNEVVELRQFHPFEKILGHFPFGSTVEVEVLPFRSCLLMASTEPTEEMGVEGCAYRIIRDIPEKSVVIKLLGGPGEKAEMKLIAGKRKFTRAIVDGKSYPALLQGKSIPIRFAGRPMQIPWHRKLGTLKPCTIPEDAEALYEATCFAADNNALEVRSLYRSGPSRIVPVQKAREAFFDQPLFVERGVWDRYLFDGDFTTSFYVNRRFGGDLRIHGGSLRIDFGHPIFLDSLVIHVHGEYDLQPFKSQEAVRAQVSVDLRNWFSLRFLAGKRMVVPLNPGEPIRYFRMIGTPDRILEVQGFKNGKLVDRSGWRASNLFSPYQKLKVVKTWQTSFVLDEIWPGSYLAIAINGIHGQEGAYAAIRVGGVATGAPDRAPSFPSNTWEYYVASSDRNYTYFIPVNETMQGKTIAAVVLAFNRDFVDLKPEVWITAYPIPFVEKTFTLSEQ